MSSAAPARSVDWSPLYAEPMLALPDAWSEPVRGIDGGSGGDDVPYGFAVRDFYESCPAVGEPAGSSAFGWPVGELGMIYRWQDPYVHLLKANPFGVTHYFMIPPEAFRAGDFGRAILTEEAY